MSDTTSHFATHDAGYVAGMLRAMRPLLPQTDALAEECGLSRIEEKTRVPAIAVYKFWHDVQRLDPTLTLGAKVGTSMQFDKGAVAMLRYVAASTGTATDGWRGLARYYALLASEMQVEVSERSASDDSEELVIAMTNGRADFFMALTFTLGTWIKAAREFVVGDARPQYVALATKLPKGCRRDQLEEIYGTQVHDDTGEWALVFDKKTAKAPLKDQDPVLHQVLKQAADRALAELPRDETVRTAALRHIQTELPGEVTVQTLADALAIPPRTLQRRLKDEGTSFREVFDEARAKVAVGCLREGGMPVTEVAFLLGFGDVGAFSKAFRRWTGKPPSEMRR